LSWFGSLAAQPGLLAMGTGLLAGALTGTALVATGTLPDQPDPELDLLSCYEDGQAIARVRSGASMLVTARSADGAWLELYIGLPGADRGWAPATALKVPQAIDTLPIGECIGETAFGSLAPPITPGTTAQPTSAPTIVATVTPPASPAPGATPTPTPRLTLPPRPTPRPSAAPTTTALPPPPPPPTASPGPTPDVFPPSITNFGIVSPGAFNGSYYIYSNHNCGQPSATIRATVIDPSGFNWVRLYYRPPLLTSLTGNMSFKGNNIWEFVITPDGSWPQGEIGLWIQAQDGHGNTTARIPFGDPNSNLDSSLFWDPFCIA
jgi:hypothetical protein